MGRRPKQTAAKPVQTAPAKGFWDKLVLNLFMISLFGIDVFADNTVAGKNGHRRAVRPFRKLSEKLENCSRDGLAADGLHCFYHELAEGEFFSLPDCKISADMLLGYEKNIAACTAVMNAKRKTPFAWKYYQWLSLLFVEIYLDRYFGSPEKLLNDLNAFIERFNTVQRANNCGHLVMEPYKPEELNKLCLQNATGSGKTLLMVANLLQYDFYRKKYHRENSDNGLTLLITPNEKLSAQDAEEFNGCGAYCAAYSKGAYDRNIIYSLENTKLAEKDGDKSVSAAALGNKNLLFIDEGHSGLSSGEEGKWYTYRSMLCEKGFAFEYSATFKQAVEGTVHEDEYAKSILFDYSYRWFYEDGYGKDYQIFNLPQDKETAAQQETQLQLYLTAGMLKFFQQLHIYQTQQTELIPFNIEKPLWVWVGHTVTGTSKEDRCSLSDVIRILKFLAEFLKSPSRFRTCIVDLLTKRGVDTGLVDDQQRDLFYQSFTVLQKLKIQLEDSTGEQLYDRILKAVFHADMPGGHLILERVKGDSGEILLKVSNSAEYFGDINVSGAGDLCDALAANPDLKDLIEVRSDDNAAQPMFDDIKQSDSPINILIGAKRFTQGWDCWRVSVLGMFNVGKNDGPQVFQLFGRGVRLKGYQWSLKRSSHIQAAIHRPENLSELELLCVFGVSADAMVKFRKYLEAEQLPGNEQRRVITLPLTVCDLDNKKLKVLCPKVRKDNGREYNFKTDGPVPEVNGDIPGIIEKNPVLVDWYPRIQSLVADTPATRLYKPEDKHTGNILQMLDFLDFDALYFAAEHWKRQNAKYNFNCSREGIVELFKTASWYQLRVPPRLLHPQSYHDIQEIRDIAHTLLEKYLQKLYDECSSAYLKPRMEYRLLDASNANIPTEREYQIIFDASDHALEASLRQIIADLKKFKIAEISAIGAIDFSGHLFNPLVYSDNGKLRILPCSLNLSEFRFVKHLAEYLQKHPELKRQWGDIYLLRNQSRGKGMGFFEANNFYPDFILWCVKGEKQYITFVEPHGLKQEGPASAKIRFCNNANEDSIKNIQRRLHDPNVILNCFILTPTAFPQLQWGISQKELQKRHILFQEENNGETYLSEMLARIEE